MAGAQLMNRFHRPNPPPAFKDLWIKDWSNLLMQEIPPRFVREHAELLNAAAADLIDLAGTAWLVGLPRTADGKAWLRLGLEAFEVDNIYGVGQHHIIFFEAVGNAKFRFDIFDLSATEIDYPVVVGGNKLYRPESPQLFHIVEECDEQAGLAWTERLEDRVVATLIDPAGNTHRVLQRANEDGDAWFRTGWKEIINFYSLGWGDLILFKPLGNSRYQVTIFDKSTMEINYPARRRNI